MSSYQDIYDSFNDLTSNTGNLFFSDAVIQRFGERALDESCERAKYIETYDLVDSEVGVAEYATLSEGYGIYRVEYDDEILFPINRDQLRRQDRDWQYRTGLPKYYYLDEIVSTAENVQRFGVFERGTTDGSENIRVWYYKKPAQPSDVLKSTELEIPDWASPLVLYYMLYLAYTAETKIQNDGAAAIYYLLYEDVLDRLIIRSHDRQPKKWVSGGPSSPSASVLNRLPDRVPAP